MRGTNRKCRAVAAAIAMLTSTTAAMGGASAQPNDGSATGGAPDPSALTPPTVTKQVEAKRPNGLDADGAAVDLELTIAADGKLVEAKVVGSSGDELDAAALDAVRQFTFEPARRGGRPIAARIRYRYTFGSSAAAGEPATAPLARPMTGRLEGKVFARPTAARRSSSPIAGASITVVSAQNGEPVGATLSAEDGAFALPELAPGNYRVHVEAEGFVGFTATEAVVAGEATALTYRLEPAADRNRGGYAFGATASIDAPPREVTKRTLTSDELLRAAGTRGDALRVVELLPGVGRPPSLTGLLIIRGSSPLDSQAYFENGMVDRVYHFGGLTSFVNPRLLDRIDLYPGNYSARYGRKMGGIIDVGMRDPKADGYHAVADVNIIDASLMVEGPVSERGSFAFAAKRSYIDFWFNNVVPKDAVGVTAAPVYWDYQGIYTYRPQSGGRLRLIAVGSADVLRLVLKQPADGDPTVQGNIGQRTLFHRVQVEWKRNLGDAVEQEISAGIGTFHNDVGIGTSLGFNIDGPDGFLRAEWRAKLSEQFKLIGGFDGVGMRADVTYDGPVAQATEGNPAYNGGPLSALPTAHFAGIYQTYRPAAYVEALVQAGERLLLVPGVRFDYYSEIGARSVDPRLTARFKVAPETVIKGGVGLFSQPPQYGETVAPVGNPRLGLSHAQHYSVGIEQGFGARGSISAEGFYKRLSDLEVNGADAEGARLLVNGGKGRIYGLEVLARLNPVGPAFGFVSYTLSRSERNDDGTGWRLFDYDQTHILTITGGYKLGRGWDLGSTFRLVSGSPRTPVVASVYDANNDYYVPVYGKVNSARDPLFHQLSIRVEKAWKFRSWQLASYLDVQNVYNHRSQEGLQWSYDYARSKPVQGLPVLPSVGVRAEF